jgi:hypothetical protein
MEHITCINPSVDGHDSGIIHEERTAYHYTEFCVRFYGRELIFVRERRIYINIINICHVIR